MRRSSRRSAAPTPGEPDTNPQVSAGILTEARISTRTTRRSSARASKENSSGSSNVATDVTSEVSGPSAPKRGGTRKTGAKLVLAEETVKQREARQVPKQLETVREDSTDSDGKAEGPDTRVEHTTIMPPPPPVDPPPAPAAEENPAHVAPFVATVTAQADETAATATVVAHPAVAALPAAPAPVPVPEGTVVIPRRLYEDVVAKLNEIGLDRDTSVLATRFLYDYIVEKKEPEVGLIVSEAAQAAFSGEDITLPTNYKLEDILDSALTLGDVRKLTVCYTNKSKKITAWGPLSQKLLKWLYPPQKKANTIAFNISSGRVVEEVCRTIRSLIRPRQIDQQSSDKQMGFLALNSRKEVMVLTKQLLEHCPGSQPLPQQSQAEQPKLPVVIDRKLFDSATKSNAFTARTPRQQRHFLTLAAMYELSCDQRPSLAVIVDKIRELQAADKPVPEPKGWVFSDEWKAPKPPKTPPPPVPSFNLAYKQEPNSSSPLTEIKHNTSSDVFVHFRVLAFQLLLLFLLFSGDLARFPKQAYDTIVGDYVQQAEVIVTAASALTSPANSTLLTVSVNTIAVATFVVASVVFHVLISVASWLLREYYRNYFDIEDWLWGCADWWAKKRSGDWSTTKLMTSPGIPLSVVSYLFAVGVLRQYSPYPIVIFVNAVAWCARHTPTIAKWLYSGLIRAGVSPYSVGLRKLGVFSGVVTLPKPPVAKSAPAWDAGIVWQRMRVMHENENSRLWFSMYWPKHTTKDVDANFFEQWITTLRAAIGYKPELSTVDFLVTQPGNHRAYRVVSKQFVEGENWEEVKGAGSNKGRPWSLFPHWLHSIAAYYGVAPPCSHTTKASLYHLHTDKAHATEFTWDAHVRSVGQKIVPKHRIYQIAAGVSGIALVGLGTRVWRNEDQHGLWVLPVVILRWMVGTLIRASLTSILRHLLPFRSKKQLQWSPKPLVAPLLCIAPLFVLAALYHLPFSLPWLDAKQSHAAGLLFGIAMCFRVIVGDALQVYTNFSAVIVVASVVFQTWVFGVTPVSSSLALLSAAMWFYVSQLERVTVLTTDMVVFVCRPLALIVACWHGLKWVSSRVALLCRRLFGRRVVGPLPVIPADIVQVEGNPLPAPDMPAVA